MRKANNYMYVHVYCITHMPLYSILVHVTIGVQVNSFFDGKEWRFMIFCPSNVTDTRRNVLYFSIESLTIVANNLCGYFLLFN